MPDQIGEATSGRVASCLSIRGAGHLVLLNVDVQDTGKANSITCSTVNAEGL